MIDINHPAHVHYFRNFISILQLKKVSFIVTARNDRMILELLDFFQIEHICRNTRPKNILLKPFYLFYSVLFVLKYSLKTKPDFFVGFASLPVALGSFLLRRPSIILDDTEHNRINHFLYEKFATLILTPTCFNHRFSKKQVFFDSFMELAYLHLNYFQPENPASDALYYVSRTILFDATHDYNIDMTSLRWKMQYLGLKLSKIYSELTVNEGSVTNFHPARLHEVLFFAKLYIGEGATMASESACLGIPSIYSNKLKVGYLEELKSKYGVLYDLDDFKGEKDLDRLFEIIISSKVEEPQIMRERICNEKIDITKLLVWLVLDFSFANELVKNRIIDREFVNGIKARYEACGLDDQLG